MFSVLFLKVQRDEAVNNPKDRYLFSKTDQLWAV